MNYDCIAMVISFASKNLQDLEKFRMVDKNFRSSISENPRGIWRVVLGSEEEAAKKNNPRFFEYVEQYNYFIKDQLKILTIAAENKSEEFLMEFAECYKIRKPLILFFAVRYGLINVVKKIIEEEPEMINLFYEKETSYSKYSISIYDFLNLSYPRCGQKITFALTDFSDENSSYSDQTSVDTDETFTCSDTNNCCFFCRLEIEEEISAIFPYKESMDLFYLSLLSENIETIKYISSKIQTVRENKNLFDFCQDKEILKIIFLHDLVNINLETFLKSEYPFGFQESTLIFKEFTKIRFLNDTVLDVVHDTYNRGKKVFLVANDDKIKNIKVENGKKNLQLTEERLYEKILGIIDDHKNKPGNFSFYDPEPDTVCYGIDNREFHNPEDEFKETFQNYFNKYGVEKTLLKILNYGNTAFYEILEGCSFELCSDSEEYIINNSIKIFKDLRPVFFSLLNFVN